MRLWGDVLIAQVDPNNSSGSLISTNGWPTAAMLVVVVGAVVFLAKMLLSRADQRYQEEKQRSQEWKSLYEAEKENSRRAQATTDKALANAEAELMREKGQVERDQVLLKIVDALRQSPGKLAQ